MLKLLGTQIRWTIGNLFKHIFYRKGFHLHRSAIYSLFMEKGMTGIEIGAANHPALLPPGVNVKYLDYVPPEQFKEWFNSSRDVSATIKVDIIDNASTLSKVADSSVDFIITNHVIEHFQDPLEALTNFFRVLKPGGYLFASLPDKRKSLDKKRPVTPFDHLLKDHLEGPAASLRPHVEEVAQLSMNFQTEAETTKFIEKTVAENMDVHFHVWTPLEFLNFLHRAHQHINSSYELEHFSMNAEEFDFVLKKSPEPTR